MKKIPLSRKITYRQADSKTLMDADDTGYIFYCTSCTEKDARYGGPVFGKRIINIKICNEHQLKKGKIQDDMARIDKLSWSVDPPKEKFPRSKAFMERSREKTAERIIEKQGRGSFVEPDGSKIIL